uniref:RRM domain-containing protein n=1 Tax=Arundo donax TaxID=35708 RepID=A0A0A9GMV4_ARUDO
MLHHLFKTRYPSVMGAKVIFDKVTGCSKSYGFVSFGDVNEYVQAMTEMDGAYCSTRPMRIRPAPNKKKPFYNTQRTADSDQYPNNSRLFVGCLNENVTDEDLKQAFSSYGELVDVKVLAVKNCGFVTYSNRASAEEAIRVLNGSKLGRRTIKLSFGRRCANKQDQRNGGHYGRQLCYDPSGFRWCPQDPYDCAQIGGSPGFGYYQHQ